MTAELSKDAVLLGRIWDPAVSGPCVVTVRDGVVFDVTLPAAPLVRDICEMDDPASWLCGAQGRPVAPLADLLAAPAGDLRLTHLIAPCDLQAVKACGVTFAGRWLNGSSRNGPAAIPPAPRRSVAGWAR